MRKPYLFGAAVWVLAGAWAGGALAEDDTTPDGAVLYRDLCGACHTPVTPGAAPPVALADYQSFSAAVLGGRGDMPPVVLSETELGRIWDYLTAASQSP